MPSSFKILALSLALVLSACTEKAPQQEAQELQEVQPAVPPDELLAPSEPPATVEGISGTYTMDSRHTDVIVQWSHFGFSNPSMHFGQVAGTIVFDADNIAASSVEVTIPLTGLEAYDPEFNQHLLGAEFFDADKFPEITFKSTAVEVEGRNQLKVTGDLTIKGTTRQAVLEVTVNGFGEHPMSKRPTAGFDAVATINRSDFGLGAYAPAVSDEIHLRITTEAPAPLAAEEGAEEGEQG